MGLYPVPNSVRSSLLLLNFTLPHLGMYGLMVVKVCPMSIGVSGISKAPCTANNRAVGLLLYHTETSLMLPATVLSVCAQKSGKRLIVTLTLQFVTVV